MNRINLIVVGRSVNAKEQKGGLKCASVLHYAYLDGILDGKNYDYAIFSPKTCNLNITTQTLD